MGAVSFFIVSCIFFTSPCMVGQSVSELGQNVSELNLFEGVAAEGRAGGWNLAVGVARMIRMDQWGISRVL